MSVKTTLNIHMKILEKINNASEISGISRSEIIKRVLMEVMAKDTERVMPTGLVKYQDKDDKDMWHKFHITLRVDEYEYFMDLRKVLKMSVSRLVAYAVKKYLDEILFGKKCDNTLFQNYIISKESADGIIFWKILWGLPQNVEKFIQID